MRPTYLIETVWTHSPLPDYPVLPGTHPAHAWSWWSVRGMGLPPMRRTVLESNDFNAFSRVRPFAAFPVRAFVTLVDEHFFLFSSLIDHLKVQTVFCHLAGHDLVLIVCIPWPIWLQLQPQTYQSAGSCCHSFWTKKCNGAVARQGRKKPTYHDMTLHFRFLSTKKKPLIMD